jgi:hypothetical protein
VCRATRSTQNTTEAWPALVEITIRCRFSSIPATLSIILYWVSNFRFTPRGSIRPTYKILTQEIRLAKCAEAVIKITIPLLLDVSMRLAPRAEIELAQSFPIKCTEISNMVLRLLRRRHRRHRRRHRLFCLLRYGSLQQTVPVLRHRKIGLRVVLLRVQRQTLQHRSSRTPCSKPMKP